MVSDLIFISLGSNIGNKLGNITKAIHELKLLPGPIVKTSSVYVTEPWGYVDQEEFINQVIAIKTNYKPIELLDALLNIEFILGRQRTVKNAPRVIDLDILLFKDLIISESNLEIPHPRMHLRKFILVPMTEIAPNIIHPLLDQSMKELLKICKDNSSVTKLRPYEYKSQ